MGKLEFNTDPGSYECVHLGPVSVLEPAYSDTKPEGAVIEKPLPVSYFIFFHYESVNGTLMLHEENAVIQLLDDSLTYKKNQEYAKKEDLEEFLNQIETENIIGGEDLVDFLSKMQGNHFGQEFLDKLRKGLKFSQHYPLLFSAPEADFKKLLEERGNKYSWKKEFWEPIGDYIDIATYAPKQ